MKGSANPNDGLAVSYTKPPAGRIGVVFIDQTTVCRQGLGVAWSAKETLDGLIGTITASLKKNKKVQLTGFGSFTVAKRPARKGRNPSTGESIRVKASKSVRFKSGQTLKRSV